MEIIKALCNGKIVIHVMKGELRTLLDSIEPPETTNSTCLQNGVAREKTRVPEENGGVLLFDDIHK